MLTTLVLVAGTSGQALAVPPTTPTFAAIPVEAHAPTPNYVCLTSDPRRKGVAGLRNLLERTYPSTSPGATWAPCDTHSPTSQHHSGRAFDWTITTPGSRPTTAQRAVADEAVSWLLASVDGQAQMRLRRMGIAHVIWHDRIWSTTTKAWSPYQRCQAGVGGNTDCHRDHVHFSFGVAGADGNSSWWRAPEVVCGSGFRVIDRSSLDASGVHHGAVYLLWNSATSYNCVVTVKHRSLGTATSTAAHLTPQGGTVRRDAGMFGYYAGPVRAQAPGCVRWGGSAGAASYTSPFEHCS